MIKYSLKQLSRKRKKKNPTEPPTDPVNLKIFNKHVKRFESMSTDRIIKIKNKMRLNYEEGYEFVEKQAALFVLQYRGHHKRKKINVNYDKNI